jgi:hypothetical protein
MTSPTMTDDAPAAGFEAPPPPPPPAPPAPDEPSPPGFILYQEGQEFAESLERLAFWVNNLLVPVYGREVTSQEPWCPQWWRHPEAIAQFHALSMAWQELTGPGSNLTGPAIWARDYLNPIMTNVRGPQGPFAGCKPSAHRDKQPPQVAPLSS